MCLWMVGAGNQMIWQQAQANKKSLFIHSWDEKAQTFAWFHPHSGDALKTHLPARCSPLTGRSVTVSRGMYWRHVALGVRLGGWFSTGALAEDGSQPVAVSRCQGVAGYSSRSWLLSVASGKPDGTLNSRTWTRYGQEAGITALCWRLDQRWLLRLSQLSQMLCCPRLLLRRGPTSSRGEI